MLNLYSIDVDANKITIIVDHVISYQEHLQIF